MSSPPAWLNYHHLQCFRAVAREGSLARASAVLRVSSQTLSEQVQQLESALGVTLFARSARGMSMTDAGREILGYAEEIHSVGQALLRAAAGAGEGASARLCVGVDESIAKISAWSTLAPAVAAGATLAVREGAHEDLVALLRARSLDLVLSERPALAFDDPSLRCVLIRDDAVSWFAAEPLAGQLREGFPRSLDGAPVLLTAPGSALRDAAEAWIVSAAVTPRVLAEFADTSLAKAACADGLGAMLLPRATGALAAARYGLREVGRCEGVRQQLFGITTERLAGSAAVDAVMRGGPDAGEGIS
jgi:LysR family transcriptional regulator, transcriptional activator of nhaA